MLTEISPSLQNSKYSETHEFGLFLTLSLIYMTIPHIADVLITLQEKVTEIFSSIYFIPDV